MVRTAAARRRLLFYQNLVGNCPPCPSHHLRPWYIYIPYFIISTVALSVGLLAVPLYILVKACKTKVCPKNPIPEFNTEAQKKINDLEAETLKLNEEIKNIRKNLIEKHNQRIEKLNVEMQNLIKALDKTERKVGELMNDESKIKREFSHILEKCQDS